MEIIRFSGSILFGLAQQISGTRGLALIVRDLKLWMLLERLANSIAKEIRFAGAELVGTASFYTGSVGVACGGLKFAGWAPGADCASLKSAGSISRSELAGSLCA